MLRSISLALAFLLHALCLWGAEGFAPIAPSAWAIKTGPLGAVVLEDRIRFTSRTVEYLYRVRVFSESGRQAAEIEDLPMTAYNVRGRTVYPDGRQIEFNSRKDFTERRVENANFKQTQTHLVAPGVSTDCIVEFMWTESADGQFGGLPFRFSRGLYHLRILAHPYPTEVLSVELTNNFPLAWAVHHGAGPAPDVSEASGYKRHLFRNVPPLEIPPYTLRPTLHLPTLVVFWQPMDMGALADSPADAYWERAAGRYYNDAYEDSVRKGGAFKNLAQALTSGLPDSPAKAAAELLSRLDANIANLSHATRAESAALPKDFWTNFDAKDLADAVKKGKTNNQGMRLLFYHLLKAAGLNPMIAKVPNRQLAMFNWRELSLWQFDHDFIGIERPGAGVLWFDPSLRYAAPGVVHPDFTGVPALIMDSRTWKVSKGTVGGLGAGQNIRRYLYDLDLQEDGETFKVDAAFAGYPEYAERDRFMALEASEQSKSLKEQFEKALKNLAVESASVQNTSNAKANVIWTLKGTIEREGGRNRVVDPFPGMPWPLAVPSKLDATRNAAIVLPYLATHVAVSTFKLPRGFAMRPHEALDRRNGFGRVQWIPSSDPATGVAKVVLKIEVECLSAPATEWDTFKTFLGWVEDACRRQVTLSREG